VALLALGLLALAPATTAQPTEEQIETAIQKGLVWLVGQQNADGSWYGGCDRLAYTATAVLKLETRAIELRLDPLGEEYEYHDAVQRGLDYLTPYALYRGIGVQPAGNPDANGNGKGIYFAPCGGHEIYNTGITMMALAASGHPERIVTAGQAIGRPYREVLEDAVDFMAWAQAECVPHRGGWRYSPDQCSSDNSNSGWVTLGLGYAAAAPPWGFGIPTPQFVKDELSLWIDVIQDDVNGNADDGGSWYDPSFPWVNILKTGNLIYEMGLVGDDAETPRVQDAVDYIERTWNNMSPDPGWRNHRQAMFTMMKGLSSLGIETLNVGETEIDWFAEVAQHLVDTQNPDGSWPYDYWAGNILSTAWALLTLEKAVPAFETPVPVDVKPGSCPNPFNLTDRGVLPVAVLGTVDFDVMQIDPATVRLVYDEQEVAPLRSAYEDVATPYEPFLDKPLDAYACLALGADGYMDLTFKFDAPAIAAILGDVADGTVLKLTLVGELREEFGGTPIVGEDVIRIIRKK
jgi:hypothetical protein